MYIHNAKNEDHGIWSHHFMANRWGNSGNTDRLFSWAPKSLQTVTAALKLKTLVPWKKSYDKPRQCIKKQRHYFVDKGLSSQFSSVAQSCPTLCDPMNHSTPGHPVHHQLPEFTQSHIHRVSDAIQPSHPLSSPSPPAPNPSQHQSLLQ